MNATYRYCLAQLFAVALGALLVAPLVKSGAASAAPLHPFTAACSPGTFDQTDMMGLYEVRSMRLEVTPCGASALTWTNQYGEHYAVYVSFDRFPGGGVVAYGFLPDPDIGAFMDSVPVLLIKPAEPGWIQVVTIGDDLEVRQAYRLQKIR